MGQILVRVIPSLSAITWNCSEGIASLRGMVLTNKEECHGKMHHDGR